MFMVFQFLYILQFFDKSYPNGYKVVLPCGFDLDFPNN